MIKIPPPIQTLVAALLMYGCSEYVFLSLYEITDVVLILITSILLFSTWFIFPSVWSFWKNKTTVNPIKPESATKLVVEGNYKFSRNPMYLGMAGYLVAWLIYLSNPLNIVVLFMYIKVLTKIQIKPEEQALEKLFGEDYLNYCRQVRRWI